MFPDDRDRPTYKFMTVNLPDDRPVQVEFFAVAGQRRRLLHIPNVAHTNPIPMGVRIGRYVFSSGVLLEEAGAPSRHIAQARLFHADPAYDLAPALLVMLDFIVVEAE